MLDIAAIIIAVISLCGSIVSGAMAAFPGFVTLHLDWATRHAKSKDMVARYRDPLVLAVVDLHSRIYNIVEEDFLFGLYNQERHDSVTLYTAFLVGQYFSWTYILRRKVQSLRFSTDTSNKDILRRVEHVRRVFSTNKHCPDEALFMLWRGDQLAIAEIMTVSEDKELSCLPYSKFVENYKNEDSFREWFKPITAGIQGLRDARYQPGQGSQVANRLRRSHHRLLDLLAFLDPDRSTDVRASHRRTAAAPSCECLGCTKGKVP